jgi:hypothetical protein
LSLVLAAVAAEISYRRGAFFIQNHFGADGPDDPPFSSQNPRGRRHADDAGGAGAGGTLLDRQL